MTAKQPHVSDHAMRRWLERVHGVVLAGTIDSEVIDNLERDGLMTRKLMTEAIRKIVFRGVAAGAAAVVFEGSRYIIKGHTITTVMKEKKRRRRGPRIVDRDD